MSKAKFQIGRVGRRFCGVYALVLLVSCGAFDPARTGELEQYTAAQIFERGEYELERGQPDDAAIYFGEIERLYPYSDFAKRALIMQAFAFHKDGDYPNSRASAQRYVDFYPASEDAAYAQYLLALSYYDQIDEIGDNDLFVVFHDETSVPYTKDVVLGYIKAHVGYLHVHN